MSIKKYAEPIVHIVIWLVLYLIAIMYIRTAGPFNRLDDTLLWPVTVGTTINIFIFYSVSLWLIPRFASERRFKAFGLGLLIVFFGFTLLETLLDFFFLTYIYADVDEPFWGQFITNGVLHLIFVSLGLGYGFTKNWLKKEHARLQLTREKLTSEINFLKTQLNPHFLFNVLNMAFSSASQSGDERTADIIEKLSGLMRYMIYESNAEKVEMDREIAFIRRYIQLQKMRFSSDIPVKIIFQVNGNPTPYRIAPLILISFIENAFKYGVKLEQESEISFSLTIHEGEMEFVAKNKVFHHQNILEDNNKGIGLKNTRKRLAIIYPEKHKLSVLENEGIFVVKLWLKLS